ncbi:MAG: UvrD-helicase domain-containing protein, partial [Candidatus Roseilinea sp.]|uniref:UvrD-helicase domain-containing protein n=1 Tax=Candidatus Roseilinea sp. TaxID=2838777 RepID=UPI00404980FA
MQLRQQQAAIAAYRGGLMVVSAAPGSGKTHTLAALAAHLIRDGMVPPESEVLVVTFTHSAVDTIQARIRRALQAEQAPTDRFRVMTLHSLANQIVRERPDLAGTAPDFRIDDELSGRQTLPEAARSFIETEYDYWRSFLPPDLPSRQAAEAEAQWRETTQRIGNEVTRLAKNLRLTPADLRCLIASQPASQPPISPFLRIGAAIYERYERILSAGGRLDFDDLIWRAIIALNNDDAFRRRLGQRWLYILEDEAQDSTPLQEEILGVLSREHGNWVRMGDSNQAIMTTFTASDVRFFRDEFPRRPGVRKASLSASGRSAQPIIDLANRLADWAVQRHPEPEVRRSGLSNAVRIEPVAPDDPQPNPPADECIIHVQPFGDGEAEKQRVAESAARYVLQHPGRTCGVLVPTNAFGRLIVGALQSIQERHQDRLLFEDQLRNPTGIRVVARVLGQALRFCSQPLNSAALIGLRQALADLVIWDRRAGRGEVRGVAEAQAPYGAPANDARVNTLLRSARLERLLFPEPAGQSALPDRVEVSRPEQAEIDQLAALA